eukprot:CAMPEP_0206047668 /NCGR_PEP_ID=MMETSP1466-20131121/21874_1 /ASSEMBLY_ACC=CAM_ASM_001126 /TAXON_ID=44452 /ORGANISM="Pavlova gyrans, Strain CCMP608" /LENGTH=112 /DNA_ID=CAMNT_0053422687 /DNA_START=139 /DNA_END=474 /DNA_ORIENTATION=-
MCWPPGAQPWGGGWTAGDPARGATMRGPLTGETAPPPTLRRVADDPGPTPGLSGGARPPDEDTGHRAPPGPLPGLPPRPISSLSGSPDSVDDPEDSPEEAAAAASTAARTPV